MAFTLVLGVRDGWTTRMTDEHAEISYVVFEVANSISRHSFKLPIE